MGTTRRMKDLELPDRGHMDGCAGERIERYPADRPANERRGTTAQKVTVVRCIDCGGEVVYDQEGNREWA